MGFTKRAYRKWKLKQRNGHHRDKRGNRFTEKNLVILKKLIPTHYHKKAQGKVIVKKTLWYLVEFNGKKETPLIPDENEGITKCKWFSLNELVLVLEESHERIRYLMEFCLNMPFFKQYINKTSLF